MKQKITKEQLDKIMRRWIAYADSIGCRDGDRGYVACEQAFVFGSMAQILDCTVGEIMNDQVPPIVMMCIMSHRPISSVGNWDADADTQRLATASRTR